MTKIYYSLILAFVLSNFAWAISPSIRLAGQQVKRVTALEIGQYKDELIQAHSEGKYAVEIERMAQIRVGAYQSVESIKASFGLLYREGFTVKAGTELDGLHELSDFDERSLQATLNFGDISYIKEGDEYTYNVEGTTIISPNVKFAGLWITIGGTWSLTVKRKSSHHFILSVSLLKLKDGSICFSKGWVYGGLGISSSLEQGITFSVRDEYSNVQKVVSQFLNGDIRSLQNLADKNKNYKIIKKTEENKKGKYSYMGMMSPYFSWLGISFSSGLTEKENHNMSASDKLIKHEKSVTYVADAKFQLLNYLSSHSRTYKIADDLLTEIEGAKLESLENWEAEWSVAGTSQIISYLRRIKEATLLTKELQIDIPANQNAGYAKVNFEVQYNPANFIFVQNHKDLIDQIRRTAYAQLQSDYQKKFEEVPTNAMAGVVYNQLMNEKMQQELDLNFAWAQLRKYYSRDELTLEHRALLMRAIFRSPYMYKQWFEISKSCGLSYKLSISTSNYNLLINEKKFAKKSLCD